VEVEVGREASWVKPGEAVEVEAEWEEGLVEAVG
jgi:hypothetical protein